uniref:Ig-like domain-containing protein n=1 Tax=Seriola lalandi dorsalis TaxID=1841481 RepID=A0A3B4YAV3_SERLL
MLGRGSTGLQEKVQGIPPAFLKPLIKKRVFENDSLTFCAEVFGLPSPDVKWFCNKTQLVADDRVKMERDGDTISLTIHNVTKADQGEYICEAVNYVGEARSVALVVVVSQEVRFMPAPPAVTHQHVMEFDVEEDDSSRSPSPQEILLEVELDENEVKEFEKQVKIITIPEYTADNKSMIISLDVLPSIYEEGAVDFVTQEHDELKIAFEVTEMPPRFINPICDMEAPEGTTVMFECSLMGIPSPIVSWFKDGSGFINMKSVKQEDSGLYTCKASNPFGEASCGAELVQMTVVQKKGYKVSLPGQDRARSDQMVYTIGTEDRQIIPSEQVGSLRDLDISAATVHQSKMEVEHAAAGQKVVVQESKAAKMEQSISSHIKISTEAHMAFEQSVQVSRQEVRSVTLKSQEKDLGAAIVTTSLPPTTVPTEQAVDVSIQKEHREEIFKEEITVSRPEQREYPVIPPTFVKKMEPKITWKQGIAARLQCSIKGSPELHIHWFWNERELSDGEKYKISFKNGVATLEIMNLMVTDSGSYTCEVSNNAGSESCNTLIAVKGLSNIAFTLHSLFGSENFWY